MRAMNRALSSAHSLFGSPQSLYAIQRSLLGIYAPMPTMFLTLCLFGGMKEPSMYTHCCGLYLGVFIW